MRCRAASVCRQAAATSTQYLWITDDILTDAYHRFARVSLANARRSEGRRYGSHVPGPLEARRRSAKRRMGVSANTVQSPPPGMDFGALFGFGGSQHDFKVGEFKYQPPRPKDSPHSVEATDFSSFFGSRQKEKKHVWEQLFELPAIEEQEDPIKASKVAFAELLTAKEHLTTLSEEDLVDVLAFLRSARDEPDADNLATLEPWLSQRTVSTTALEATHELVLEKLKLQTLGGGKLPTILLSWLANSQRPLAHIIGILDSLSAAKESLLFDPADSLPLVTKAVTQQLCAHLSPGEAPSPILLHWLTCLRKCSHLQDWHLRSPVWHDIYQILSKHFPRANLLVDHFAELTVVGRRHDLATILLRHWVPQVLPDNASSTTVEVTTAGRNKRHISFRDLQQFQWTDVERYFDQVRATRRPVKFGSTRRARLRARTSTLVDLLGVLERYGIPSREFSVDLFSIMMHKQTLAVVYALFRQMCWVNFVGIHDDLAMLLIHFFQRNGRLDYAFTVFKNCPTISTLRCRDLATALAHDGCDAYTIWTMLARQTNDDIVPRRERVPHKNSLKPAHIDLIYTVAKIYADSPNVTAAVAFRRVWQCYIYLQDRGVPLTTVLTRAFVTSGIIRPLKEFARPTVARTRFILYMVQKVEGKEVALQLDGVLQQLWQKKVLPERLAAQRLQRDQMAHSSSLANRDNNIENWYQDRLTFGHKKSRPEQLVDAAWNKERKEEPEEVFARPIPEIHNAESDVQPYRPEQVFETLADDGQPYRPEQVFETRADGEADLVTYHPGNVLIRPTTTATETIGEDPVPDVASPFASLDSLQTLLDADDQHASVIDSPQNREEVISTAIVHREADQAEELELQAWTENVAPEKATESSSQDLDLSADADMGPSHIHKRLQVSTRGKEHDRQRKLNQAAVRAAMAAVENSRDLSGGSEHSLDKVLTDEVSRDAGTAVERMRKIDHLPLIDDQAKAEAAVEADEVDMVSCRAILEQGDDSRSKVWTLWHSLSSVRRDIFLKQAAEINYLLDEEEFHQFYADAEDAVSRGEVMMKSSPDLRRMILNRTLNDLRYEVYRVQRIMQALEDAKAKLDTPGVEKTLEASLLEAVEQYNIARARVRQVTCLKKSLTETQKSEQDAAARKTKPMATLSLPPETVARKANMAEIDTVLDAEEETHAIQASAEDALARDEVFMNSSPTLWKVFQKRIKKELAVELKDTQEKLKALRSKKPKALRSEKSNDEALEAALIEKLEVLLERRRVAKECRVRMKESLGLVTDAAAEPALKLEKSRNVPNPDGERVRPYMPIQPAKAKPRRPSQEAERFTPLDMAEDPAMIAQEIKLKETWKRAMERLEREEMKKEEPAPQRKFNPAKQLLELFDGPTERK